MLINNLIEEINLILKNKNKIKLKLKKYKNINLYTYEISKNEINYDYVLSSLNIYLESFSNFVKKDKYIKILHYNNSQFYYVSINFDKVSINDINNNFVVISGPDGVGKSYYLNLIKSELESFDDVFFFGHHIKDYKKNISKIEKKKKYNNSFISSIKGLFLFKILVAFYTEYLYLKNINKIKLKNFNKIIILERFLFDRLVIFKLVNVFKINYIILSFFRFFSYKPKLYICLSDTPEKIYSRKKELTIENIKIYNDKLIILLKSNKINYELIELHNKKIIPIESIINSIIASNIFTLSKYIESHIIK